MEDLISTTAIDHRLKWSLGHAESLAKRGKLPHYKLPDGSIRFRWVEIEALIHRVPVANKTHAIESEAAHG